MNSSPSTTGGTGRRLRRRLVFAGLAALLLAALTVLSLRYQPSATRAEIPVGADAERGAARMVSKASAVAAGLEHPGEWGEAISESEANAWLAHDLPRIAARLLPEGWQSVTVRFHPRRAAFSGVVGRGGVSARWWAILDVGVGRENEIVIAVESAGVGLFPVPAGVVLGTIARLATAPGWRSEIRTHEGGQRLHLTPPGGPGGARSAGGEYHLEGLRIDEGELVFAGSTRASGR